MLACFFVTLFAVGVAQQQFFRLAAAGSVDNGDPPGFNGPQPLDLERWRNKRLMVISAHPDDVEYYVGGTIAKIRELDLNVSVAYLVVTTGNAGGACYNMTTGAYQPKSYVCEREELAFIRRQEMKAAGHVLGTNLVWRCGFDDGMMVAYHESVVRERIAAFIRLFQPHIVVTHYPYPNFEAPQTCNGKCSPPSNWDDSGYHPDHKTVGWHVLNTCYGGGSAAANNKLFEELREAGGLQEWNREELYFFALTRNQPMTHYVILSNASFKRKLESLGKHRSQYPEPPYEQVEFVGSTVAKEAGIAGLAEGFQGFF